MCINKKVLIIGIDGGTWTILAPAMEQGYMPHLKELVACGASGILTSTIPAITPAAWGSFQTGMNPGENGVYNFYRWDKKQQKGIVASSKSLHGTIWDIASGAGKRVGVLNVPMTYPPKQINGYMVTGMLTPSVEAEFTYPCTLKGQLLKAVGDYDILNLENARKGAPHKQFREYVQWMTSIIDSRTRAAEFIINKEPLDIFMVHFQASDVIQHSLWCYMDREHPLYDPEKQHFIFDNFYRQLDQKIDRIRQAFAAKNEGDYLTFVISDHGFQGHYKKFDLGRWLGHEGFVRHKIGYAAAKPSLPVRWAKQSGIGKLLRSVLSPETVAKMEGAVKLKEEHADSENSKVHLQLCCAEAFIFLLEENDTQRLATAQELAEKIQAIKDPENGRPVAAAIHRKEDIYRGRSLDLMPDLVVVPSGGYSFYSQIGSAGELLCKVNTKDDLHIGMHHPDGILVVSGKVIKQQNKIKCRIVDVAPSILYCLGLPIRQDSDGKVLENLFLQQFLDQNPITTTSPADPDVDQKDADEVYSSQDEREIEERLKNLGYL